MSPIDWARMWRPERAPLETVVRAAFTYGLVVVAFRVVGRRELGRHSTYEIVLLLFVGLAMRQTIVGNDPSLTTAMIGLSLCPFPIARQSNSARIKTAPPASVG